MKYRIIPYIIVLLPLLSGCGQGKKNVKTVSDESRFNRQEISTIICRRIENKGNLSAEDSVLADYYRNTDNPLLWINRDGSSSKTDSLLYWLENAYEQHGINSGMFPTTIIRKDADLFKLQKIKKKPIEPALIAELEYEQTISALTYARILQYGMIEPDKILNRIEDEDPQNGRIPKQTDGSNRKKKLYDIRLKSIDKKSFTRETLNGIAQNPSGYLREIQPKGVFYKRLQQELARLDTLNNDSCEGMTLAECRARVRLNMERLRWQPQQAKGEKYIIVNVPAFMLQAIDETSDSILEMRICCGSKRNKTPLLASTINLIELNPYWNVPQSIIRKEIIPSYRRDTSYFTRNRMKIYNKEGKQLNPHEIKWSKYGANVPFEVRQDNKDGNSLGRIIFRFPNPFAVYLHDTPSRWAFMRKNRAVSHGCVRVEKALDLSFFLLDEPDDILMDRIRVAVDKAAETEKGKKYINRDNYKEMKYHTLNQHIPVFLDYYTIYLSKNGNLNYCEDIYGYDQPLLQALDSLNSPK